MPFVRVVTAPPPPILLILQVMCVITCDYGTADIEGISDVALNTDGTFNVTCSRDKNWAVSVQDICE